MEGYVVFERNKTYLNPNTKLARSNTDELTWSIWDLGGQDTFHALHNLFMTRQGVYLLVFDMHRLYQEMQEREQVELDDEGKHTCNELLSLLLWLQAVSMYVVFEREARELTFSCFHQNVNCITSIICITHLY